MALTRYSELRNELMRRSFPNIYAPVVLRDADSNYVPIPISERLVQCIWYDQRLNADGLRTIDGRRVRVVSPGWWNLESGPDFRHATVQIDDEPEQTGDIEIHLRAEDWNHHGHERDHHFNDVILHVVLWEAGSRHVPRTRAGQIIPQIVIQHHLDCPLEQLYDEIDLDSYPHNVGNHHGQCAHILQALDGSSLTALLDAAGEERFAAKVRRFLRWIHRVGAEQAFYEGWMEALGYKSNKVAFRTLAQRATLADITDKRAHLAPILFGVANFLPTGAPPSRAGADAVYVKRLWNAWWKLRPDFADRVVPVSAWRFHGVRPANHPHRRLGAAVALLKKHPQLMERVIGAIESGGDPVTFFVDITDDYWSRHFTLGGKTQSQAGELIGLSRAQEIVANIVLPFAAAQGENIRDPKLYEAAKMAYAQLPAASSNSILRLAATQLFDNSPVARRCVKTTRHQQGLMQIFHDFCVNDKSGCHHCQFPDLVRRWTTVAT
ncbi:MAG TPA: DUF2851 family protein [Verrucomicrobiae bacterium]|nr:DUF2851 family protein [Verrucomicrobiae bacterium]